MEKRLKEFLFPDKKKDSALKKRARLAAGALLIVIFGAAIAGNLSAYLGNLDVKDYFGESYSELWHRASMSDKQFAIPAAEQLEAAFSFTGTAEEAQERFGVLARYCGSSEGGYELKFVTASAAGGYLWITYSNDTSSDVLVRLSITDSAVTGVMEHP